MIFTVASLKPSHLPSENLFDCFTVINYFTVESLKPSHLPSANLFDCSPVIYGGDKLFESFHNFQHVLFILSDNSSPLIYTHTKIFSIVFVRQGGVLFLYYNICFVGIR